MSDKPCQEWENIKGAVEELQLKAHANGEYAERKRLIAFLRRDAKRRTSSMRLVIEEIAKRIENGEGT